MQTATKPIPPPTLRKEKISEPQASDSKKVNFSMVRQNPLTLVTPVKQGDYAKLDAALMKLRIDTEKGIHQQFQDVNTIHYFRLVLMEPQTNVGKDKKSYPANFVLSTDYDGDEDEHFTALATICGELLDSLYRYCDGFQVFSSPTARKEYLKQWKVKPSAFFAGAPGRTLVQIRKENELRNYIRNFINSGDWKYKSCKEIHQTIQQNVFARPEFQWAKEKAKLPSKNWFGMALLGLILLVLLPFLIIWILLIHFLYERTDKPLGLTPSQIDAAHVRKLEEYEDLHNQNQFTQVLIMKPGWIRLLTLQGLMLFARALITNLFVDGKLMGIPTIHFARWQMLDNNKRMIFFSNFDGSWQQYLGDFIDKSGWGLTGIWSNSENFPRTRFLFTKGAYDEEHFLAWSRYYQIPTALWYCAYPNLSIKNVMNNTYIRNELSLNATEEQAKKFLKRI